MFGRNRERRFALVVCDEGGESSVGRLRIKGVGVEEDEVGVPVKINATRRVREDVRLHRTFGRGTAVEPRHREREARFVGGEPARAARFGRGRELHRFGREGFERDGRRGERHVARDQVEDELAARHSILCVVGEFDEPRVARLDRFVCELFARRAREARAKRKVRGEGRPVAGLDEGAEARGFARPHDAAFGKAEAEERVGGRETPRRAALGRAREVRGIGERQ